MKLFQIYELDRLLLSLLIWLLLYAISLFIMQAVGNGILQGVFIYTSYLCAQIATQKALQLYRFNKCKRAINQ